VFSEYEEEKYILEAVSDLKTGTFIDVGAYDGLAYSNTRALVELGWRGIMIEPGLQAFQKLLANYADKPNIVLIHGALEYESFGRPWHYGMLSEFWENPETYSTARAGNRERFEGHYTFSRSFLVPCFTWNDIPSTCDVLSIDTEGSSFEALEKWAYVVEYEDWSKHPRVICVEHDGKIEACQNILKPLEYKEIHRNKVNVIYRRKSYRNKGESL